MTSKARIDQGFTLIELLVIISIISLLSVVGMIFIKNERIKSRNTKRMNDAGQIVKAAEMYFTEHGVYHDIIGPGFWGMELCCLGHQPSETCFESGSGISASGCGNSINNIYSQFLVNLPKPPPLSSSPIYKNDKTGYLWWSTNHNNDPMLYFFVYFEGKNFNEYSKCMQAFFMPDYMHLEFEDVTICAINIQSLYGK